jgi:hypothetical protein
LVAILISGEWHLGIEEGHINHVGFIRSILIYVPKFFPLSLQSVLHYESGCGNKSSSSGDQKPKTLTADAVGFGTSIEAGDQPKATEEVEVFAEENATAAVPIASSPPADDDMANFLIEQIPIGA